ncbi:MAG: serine hydrolase domain-containing protein [Actinomycetota bacterium]
MSYDDAFGLIAEHIERSMEAWGPPAVAIVVTDREQTLWTDAFGYANVEKQVPATTQSLFQIGSVGKSFTALLLMQEVEAGTVGLQRPIKDIVPWFEVHERIRPITVEDILLHASGLPTGEEGFEPGLAEALTMLEFEPGFAPGNGFLYSNLGYKIIGFALERLTGQRYPDLVAERIFAPLRMASSFGEITQALRPVTAIGYRSIFTDRPAQASHPWMEVPFPESATADGCISSTIEDMARYVRVFANNGAYPDGQIISPASFEIMTRGQNTDPETGDKLGFGIWTTERLGRPILEHTGGMIAHRTHMAIDPETGIGLVMLGSGAEVHRLAEYALQVLGDVATASPLRAIPGVDAREIPKAEDFRGRWRGGQRELTLTPEGVGLIAEADGERVAAELREDDILLLPMPGWDLFLLRASRDPATRQVVSLTHGPDRFFTAGAEGYVAAPTQALEPMVGHYRSWSPWTFDVRVFQREGKLFMQVIDGSNDPGDAEYELVELPGQRTFGVGADDWLPDRIRFERPIDGKTQIAYFMNAAYGRLPSP